MTNIANENLNNNRYEAPILFRDCVSVNLEKMCKHITNAASEVYENLAPGLPKSVYQLKFLNNLAAAGLQLEEEISALAECVNEEPVREIIIVNGMLVIECIVEEKIIEHDKKRIMFDVVNNNHEMGLIINFGEGMDSGMLKVYQNTVPH